MALNLSENCTHLNFNDDWLDLYLRILGLMYVDVTFGEGEEGINDHLRRWRITLISGKWKLILVRQK